MSTKFQGTDQERRALNAVITLMRASHAVNTGLAAKRSADGLTMAQFAVLEALLHCGTLCQRDLAGKLLVTGANITRVLDVLERDGLVERIRSQTDRRYISVGLTAQGRARIAALFPRHVAEVVEAFSVLSSREQETLRSLCRKLGRGQAHHQENP